MDDEYEGKAEKDMQRRSTSRVIIREERNPLYKESSSRLMFEDTNSNVGLKDES